MADIKSAEERSLNMSKIRGKDTKPEIAIRKMLFQKGYRYRKNVSSITGHPDLYLAKYNTAVFVHGCFWHRHQDCKYAYIPKSRTEFWETKFRKNTERDSIVQEQLKEQNIRILIIWECTVKEMLKSDETKDNILNQIGNYFKSTEKYLEL